MDRQNPWIQKAITILILLIGVYDFLALGGLFEFSGIYVSAITHRGVNLLFFLVLTYLIMPAKKGKTHLPWYDIILLLAGLIPTLYVTVQPERVMVVTEDPDLVNTVEIILFLLLVASILEAGRRSGGLGMFIVAIFFFSAVFLGDYYPGPFYARTISFQSVTAYMYLCLGANSIFGLIADIGSTILIAFMLFGGFLQASGAAGFFLKLGIALAGRYRGGPAKVAIFASALMGSISGSGVANVVTTGTLTIPLMIKTGYRPYFAGAVEAVASNGGQIMPPVMGAVAFIIAKMLGISYWEVCVAAFLPAFLYYAALFFMIDFEAVKNGLKGLPREEIPSLKETLKKGWYYLVPILLLILLVADRTFSVHRSCIFSIVSLILLSFFGGRDKYFTPKKMGEALDIGIRSMVSIAGSLYTAGIIIASIQMAGIGINFTRLIQQFAGHSTLLMLMLAAVSSFILGMGMSSIPCYIVLALLVGPPLIEAGILPLAAHLFFFYWGILSFITPPVAVSALAASGIAGADFWKTGWTAARLGIISYIIPFFFIYEPSLLLKGSIGEVVVAMTTGLIGCYILASGMIGYLLKRLDWIRRGLMIGCGILVIYPGWQSDIIGIAFFAFIGAFQWLSRRPKNTKA